MPMQVSLKNLALSELMKISCDLSLLLKYLPPLCEMKEQIKVII